MSLEKAYERIASAKEYTEEKVFAWREAIAYLGKVESFRSQEVIDELNNRLGKYGAEIEWLDESSVDEFEGEHQELMAQVRAYANALRILKEESA